MFVTVIGDAHDSPGLDQSRFGWIGREIRDRRPDAVISIGDFASLDSLCSHAPNDTLRGKRKPSLLEDLASLERAIERLNLPPNLRRHITKGNHEDRAHSFTDRHPEVEGMVATALDRIFLAAGFTISEFGDVFSLAGVDFTHVPKTVMDKPMGGEQTAPRVVGKITRDIVFGHGHLRESAIGRKVGHRMVRALQVGCALPWGHIEPYAAHSLTGWWWGLHHLRIEKGSIIGEEAIPMCELQARWGKK